MNRFPRPLFYTLTFALVFLLGWQSSSYYITKKLALDTKLKQEDLSPVSAVSSLLNPQNGEKSDLSTFWKVWDMLDNDYVDTSVLQKQEMVYGAIKGLTASLGDPYTVYMTPEETRNFDEDLKGKLEGIGAELTVRDQNLVVVSPMKDSPSEKAGLKPEDIVYKIDGQLTAEMTLFEAISNIRGKEGTKVTLTIIRKGTEQPFDLAIERKKVDIESVSMEDKQNGIFLLTINQFNDTTKPEFEEKISQLLLQDPKGLILDLRFNGGGLLEGAVDVLSEFIKGKKVAVTIKRRDSKNNQTLYTSDSARLPEIPLVVLINNGSASASEIVAGAIQDLKRGIVMGTPSFGKGSVQEVDPLSDGSSLRMTIAKWYTPNDNNIDKVGIIPDISVPVNEDELKKNVDNQLNAAVDYLSKLNK